MGFAWEDNRMETFASALARRKALSEKHTAERRAVQKEYEASVMAAYAVKYPKRKAIREKAFLDSGTAAILATFRAQANGMLKRQGAAVRALETRLEFLARRESVRPDLSVWTKAYVVWESTYQSQGFGAAKYARNAAESKADDYRFHGLTVDVREEKTEHGTRDYAVWVNADETTCEQVSRLDKPDLKEWVRLCWKRGVNPQVYCPFLPPGFEERVGLDYFGNERRPQ